MSLIRGLVDWSRVASFLALLFTWLDRFYLILMGYVKKVWSSLQRNVMELKAEINGAMRDVMADMMYFFITWKLERLLCACLEYSEFCYLISCRLTLKFKLQNICLLKDVDCTACSE